MVCFHKFMVITCFYLLSLNLLGQNIDYYDFASKDGFRCAQYKKKGGQFRKKFLVSTTSATITGITSGALTFLSLPTIIGPIFFAGSGGALTAGLSADSSFYKKQKKESKQIGKILEESYYFFQNQNSEQKPHKVLSHFYQKVHHESPNCHYTFKELFLSIILINEAGYFCNNKFFESINKKSLHQNIGVFDIDSVENTIKYVSLDALYSPQVFSDIKIFRGKKSK